MLNFHKIKENKITFFLLLIYLTIILTTINCQNNLKRNFSFLSGGESNKIIAKYNIYSTTEERILLLILIYYHIFLL